MKILIVEDEPSLCELMARTLRKEQYVVETASTFTEASERLGVYSYDCVLLDIMLPDGNGLRLLEELKMQDKRENVIIISARDSLEDKILGLEEGADDYLPKPFHMAELSARIRSVVRRSRGSGRSSIVLGNVTLDPESFRVEVAGRKWFFSKKSSTYCPISCNGRGTWWTRPYWPRPCGATMPTRRTISILSIPR